jgi:hypothetical protein
MGTGHRRRAEPEREPVERGEQRVALTRGEDPAVEGAQPFVEVLAALREVHRRRAVGLPLIHAHPPADA